MLSMGERMKDKLLYGEPAPFVFKDAICDWESRNWTPELLDTILDLNGKSKELEGSKSKIKFRLGKLTFEGTQFETKCRYEIASIRNFMEWKNGTSDASNPFASYDNKEYWAYADYKYMAEMFSDDSEALKSLDWSKFGFKGRGGKESTLWLGSKGAHTPCHYDSYGCNLVAQIYGRKRWILVSPDQSHSMYPTRIPYEESSVFSEINFNDVDFHRHPKVKNLKFHVVTLCPGDVLFVPRHWWHYVYSLETSISINTWIEMEEDNNERVKESLIRILTTSLMSQEEKSDWLNPTEVAEHHNVSLMYVNESLKQARSMKSRKRVHSDPPSFIPMRKKSNNETESSREGKTFMDSDDTTLKDASQSFWLKHGLHKCVISACDFSKLTIDNHMRVKDSQHDSVEGSSGSGDGISPISSRDLINCLANRQVLQLVSDLLCEKLDEKQTSPS